MGSESDDDMDYYDDITLDDIFEDVAPPQPVPLVPTAPRKRNGLFPFFDLPFDQMKKAMEAMNKADLLELSFTSKKAAQFARKAQIFADGYEIQYNTKNRFIHAWFSDGTHIKWIFLNSNEPSVGLTDHRKIDHFKFLSNRINESMTVKVQYKCQEASFMMRILEHFLNVFPAIIQNFEVQIYQEDNEFLGHFIDKIGFVEKLTIESSANDRMVKNLVESLEIGGRLCIKHDMSNIGDLDVYAPEVVIKMAGRVFADTGFKTLAPRFCHLKNTTVTEMELCYFLDAFLKMEAPFIKTKTPRHDCGWWKFEFSVPQRLYQLEKFLEHRIKKNNSEARDPNYSQFVDGKLEEVNLRFGQDLERSDGLLMTVCLNPGVVRILNIVVWYDRFPLEKNTQKKFAQIYTFVKSHADLNRLHEKNLRRMMMANAEIKELEAENSRLQMESEELSLTCDTAQKLKDQISRVTMN